MLTLCAIRSDAQTVTVKERLPVGEFGAEFIVLIDGVEQRTITDAHAQKIRLDKFELAKLQEAMPLCRQENTRLRAALVTAAEQAKVADEQRGIQKQIANNWKTMFDDEKELRIAAEKFIHRGRVSSFFDGPVAQIIFKGVVPLVGTIITAKK